MTLEALITAASLAAAAAAGASAANPPLAVGGPMQDVSAAEIAGIFTQAGWRTEIRAENATEQAVVVRADTGFVFVVMLRACAGAPPRCALVQPYAQWEPANVTLDQVNAFNRAGSHISTLMILDDGSTFLGAKFYMKGGVNRANLEANFGKFLLDTSLVLKSVTPGTRADVAFAARGDLQGFALETGDGVRPADLPLARNGLGAGRPGIPQAAIDAFLKAGD